MIGILSFLLLSFFYDYLMILRVNWLKDRGVFIEFPEDRYKSKGKNGNDDEDTKV